MNFLKTPFRSLVACCSLLLLLPSCSQPEELPEITQANLTIQSSGECDYELIGETEHEVMPEDFDFDWDLVVHVDFETHPEITPPCGHNYDEFCVFYTFKQPISPGYKVGIRYANDQSNTIHPLTPDGNQGYFNHTAAPIPGSPNFDPPYIKGKPRPVDGWHKVCSEISDYYVYVDFGTDAPDVPLPSLVLESSGICVVANIGTGGDPAGPDNNGGTGGGNTGGSGNNGGGGNGNGGNTNGGGGSNG